MNHRSSAGSILLGLAPLSAALVAAALEHADLSQPRDAEQDAGACPIEQRATTPVRLGDSRAIYFEPMAFAAGASARLHAGHPVYVWTKVPDDSARLDSSAAVSGIVLRDSVVAPLPAPMSDGIVTDFRLHAEGDWFYAVFARATAPAKPGRDPRILSYWFGRTDGVRWDSLEALPLPSPGVLITREASQLEKIGGLLALAVPFGNDQRRDVAVYVRDRGRWRMEIVSTHTAAYVALAGGGATPLLYVVRPDTLNVPDANSLSLFSRDTGGWRDRGFLLRGGNQPIHHPVARKLGSDWTLSWFIKDRTSHALSAHAARIASDGSFARRTILAEDITDVSPVHATSGPTRWIVAARSEERRILALVEWSDGDATVRDVVLDPFDGQPQAYSAPHGAAAVGPVLNRAPGAESLVSGTLRFALRCTSRASGGQRW